LKPGAPRQNGKAVHLTVAAGGKGWSPKRGGVGTSRGSDGPGRGLFTTFMRWKRRGGGKGADLGGI